VDSGSIERSLPQHLLDEIVQEEADALLEERGWCDPQALEARIAHRFASMTDDDLRDLREKSVRSEALAATHREKRAACDGSYAREVGAPTLDPQRPSSLSSMLAQEDRANVGGEVAEHDRGTIEALFQEHISREVYEAWYREAVDELLADSVEEGVPLAEVRQIVTRRVLLHLASVTSGQMSDSFRNVASEFRKREDEG
jgi:hypothetical protein